MSIKQFGKLKMAIGILPLKEFENLSRKFPIKER